MKSQACWKFCMTSFFTERCSNISLIWYSVPRSPMLFWVKKMLKKSPINSPSLWNSWGHSIRPVSCFRGVGDRTRWRLACVILSTESSSPWHSNGMTESSGSWGTYWLRVSMILMTPAREEGFASIVPRFATLDGCDISVLCRYEVGFWINPFMNFRYKCIPLKEPLPPKNSTTNLGTSVVYEWVDHSKLGGEHRKHAEQASIMVDQVLVDQFYYSWVTSHGDIDLLAHSTR